MNDTGWLFTTPCGSFTCGATLLHTYIAVWVLPCIGTFSYHGCAWRVQGSFPSLSSCRVCMRHISPHISSTISLRVLLLVHIFGFPKDFNPSLEVWSCLIINETTMQNPLVLRVQSWDHQLIVKVGASLFLSEKAFWRYLMWPGVSHLHKRSQSTFNEQCNLTYALRSNPSCHGHWAQAERDIHEGDSEVCVNRFGKVGNPNTMILNHNLSYDLPYVTMSTTFVILSKLALPVIDLLGVFVLVFVLRNVDFIHKYACQKLLYVWLNALCHHSSVLVLQGNSADIARHALSSSPIKRVTITLGKLLPSKTSRVPPQIARLPHPAAAAAAPISPLSRPPAVDGYIPTQSAKGSGFPNMKPHVLGPISGVLPVPTIRLPGVAQVLPSVSSVPNSSLKPLFPTAAVNHSSTYAPTAVVPQAPWSVMPRPLPPSRVPSTGTGVFFPSGWVSSGPGRPVATSQHRQPPLLQKTNSLPSLFVSPAHSGSPTKNLKASASSSQLSSDGPQGERTPLLVSNSTSLSNSGTSDEVPGKEPVMDISPPSVINDINSKKKDWTTLNNVLCFQGFARLKEVSLISLKKNGGWWG